MSGASARRIRSRRETAIAGATALATALVLLPVRASVAGVPQEPMSGPCALSRGAGFDEGPPQDDSVRPQGRKKAKMIMVDFPGIPAAGAARERASFFSRFGDTHLDRASYGRYRLDLEPTDGWIRMPRPWSSYGIGRGNSAKATQAYVQDAVDAAREQEHTDFDDTDLLYVVAADNVPAAPTVSQASTFPGLRTGGGDIRAAALVFGRAEDPALWQQGNFVHEAYHLYGLPDLYNVGADASVEWAGGWDPMSMAGISDLIGWHKWKLGWIGNDQVDCVRPGGTSTHSLQPVGSPDGARIAVARTGRNSAVVAEARTRTGLDEDICAEGVLLYTVDSSVPTGRGPVRVRDSRPSSGGGKACADRSPVQLAELGDAPFRPGESHTFPGGVTVRVDDASGDGYTVRITRR